MTHVLCLKQTKVTLLPKKSPMKIQLRRSHLIQKKTVRMVKKEPKGSLVLYRSYPAPPWSPFVISDRQVERVVLLLLRPYLMGLEIQNS